MKLDKITQYPTDTANDMVRWYKNGTTIAELSNKFRLSEYDIKHKLKKFTRLNGKDSIAENAQIIAMAEGRLLQMASEIKAGSTTGEQLQRYRALLFWYCKADLNEGVVFIPQNLLV